MTIDKVAWIHLLDRRILSTRSYGRSAFYLPGGKREPGESDLETLVREIREELTVDITPATVTYLGTFKAQAHAQPAGVNVSMRCYEAHYEGTLKPASEVAELVWLTYADRHATSPVDQLIFDYLRAQDRLTNKGTP